MTGEKYRHYQGFRGLNLCSPEKSSGEMGLSRMKNMWRDYRSFRGECLETFPGYRVLKQFPAPLNGLFRQWVKGEPYLLVHAKTSLYRFPLRDRDNRKKMAELTPIARLENRESRGVLFGSALYLADGNGIYRVAEDGKVTGLSGNVYIPTDFVNGEPYEQRNMFTPKCKHLFTLNNLSAYRDYTSYLRYTVIDEEAGEVSVGGSRLTQNLPAITLPEQVRLGEKLYTVTEISPIGFKNMENLTRVSFPETLKYIRTSAFSGCSKLEEVILPTGLEAVSSTAFYGCTALNRVSFGRGIKQLGSGAFGLTPNLNNVYFSGTEEESDGIIMAGKDSLKRVGITWHYGEALPKNLPTVYFFPFYRPAEQVEGVELDGMAVGTSPTALFGGEVFYEIYQGEGILKGVKIHAPKPEILEGRNLSVLYTRVLTNRKDYPQAVQHCRVLCVHDGRIFYTGNPDFPGAVYYSGRDSRGENRPDYVGELQYFEEGEEVRGLLPLGNTLGVFTATDEGGEVCFRKEASTGKDYLSKVYVKSQGTVGPTPLGLPLLFGEDPVYFSERGVFGLDPGRENGEKTVSCRSSKIAPILEESLGKYPPKATVFQGYLALLAGGKIFLGDSRQKFTLDGHREYEWFLLDGIGSYTGDTRVFFYRDSVPGEKDLQEKIGCLGETVPEGIQVFEETRNGKPLYFTKEKEMGEERKYPVDTLGEKTGGSFSPATHLLSLDDILFFGTEDGVLSCFSTDKRGKDVYGEEASDLFISEGGKYLPLLSPKAEMHTEDELEERELYRKEGQNFLLQGKGSVFPGETGYTLCTLRTEGEEGVIPSCFYSHSHHSYPSGFSLFPDDCGLPHLLKSTCPRSLLFRTKKMQNSRFSVFVRTDRMGFREWDTQVSSGMSPENMAFDALRFSGSEILFLVSGEKEKRWVEKQIQLISQGYLQPFGIYSFGFRYRTDGRIIK